MKGEQNHRRMHLKGRNPLFQEIFMTQPFTPAFILARRSFLGASGLALSGTAVALLSGREALAAADKAGNPANDVDILNSALAAELEAIAAYGVGAGSGLLKGPVLALATTFQGHHKQHADVLAGTVRKLGGTPAEAKAKYAFPVETLKTQNDVLKFAANLEKGAVSAYVGAVPLFKDRELAKAAASILGDEAMHWAVLRQAVGEEPVQGAFFS
jgi:rubrerythrin